ncbi:copper amine oxidase N-terminal domain-containing protein [Paenibacillus piri]|uniref:Copper amine oxidase N-terminal domain-containing protein n=1 Tax=Paenibacillus piri TaxID=2547395 RepID=A0A4V2ZUI3_9BACL|nr:copper amine oxidase N-terminal domain-containing protein [Paenibacillus piri]TDG00865.1 copper amine oxidase N-terminal domain-containing protein [Paenibacillus piri]
MGTISDRRKSKGKDIDENTQIHMSTEYTRHKPVRRKFNFVICGMLISSLLLGSIALSGGNMASAATSHPTTQAVAAEQQLSVSFQDEQALIRNLKLSVKVIEEKGFNINTISKILDGLNAVDEKLSSGGFVDKTELKPVILDVERVFAQYGSDGLLTLRNDQTTLASIKQQLGMTYNSNYASQSPVSKKNEVKILSAGVLIPSVVIDGVKQSYPQSPVIQNGSTLVPLRGIFESLGATVSWSNATETVSATKGSTEVSLKVGSEVAYVNGKQVKLTAPSTKINGFTMVPLRFIAEALGGTVKWDNETQTAYIESTKSPTSSTGQMVGGIKVLYGKHTYDSANQTEYNKVMEIVNGAIQGVDTVVFGGEKYSEYYSDYLNGARWSGNTNTTDHKEQERNKGLKSAENKIGPLVEEGLSKDEIIKVYKIVNVALNLLQGKADPGDGSPSSAADNLLYNRSDCDAEAQVYSAVFDSMSYNTAIIGGANHAQIIIKIGGSWFTTAAGAFEKVDVQKALKGGSAIVVDPTLGRSTL